MTLKIMAEFGIKANFKGNVISVLPQQYKAASIDIEPDWSGASYWYSFVALASGGEIFLPNLKEASVQGDQVIKDIMTELGVSSTFSKDGTSLKKMDHKNEVNIDFTHCPDLAQTVAVVCAAKNIKCKMTGLESLKIKETDRVAALQNELSKIGARLNEFDSYWILEPSNSLPEKVTIKTYDDHRMAMAFAPLASLMNVTIENPKVVNKSFPNFWKEVNKLFKI